jgi:hypothetical protein
MRHHKLQHMLARRYELNESEEAMLRLHLTACETCRGLATDYLRDDDALGALTQADPPVTLRQAVLAQAGRRVAAQPRRISPVLTALAAAAVVLFALGLGLNRSGLLFSSPEHILSEPQAVRAALPHTVIGPRHELPPHVKLTAHLGTYAGVSRAWFVTISGPGVSVLSPEALVGQLHASEPSILHRETAVIDGHTGAFVETFAVSG